MTKNDLFVAGREFYDGVEEAIISDRLDDPRIIRAVKELERVILTCKCQLPGFDPSEEETGGCPFCGCDPTFFCDLHSIVDVSDGEE